MQDPDPVKMGPDPQHCVKLHNATDNWKIFENRDLIKNLDT